MKNFKPLNYFQKLRLKNIKRNIDTFIHFGMVQIALKPLTRLGLDCPIFMALRDSTLIRYKDSLLAMIQTNICNGPIYFNCCPNYSVDLNDPWIMDTLVLNIHLPNIQNDLKFNFMSFQEILLLLTEYILNYYHPNLI